MDIRHKLSIALAVLGAAANALATQVPAYAALFNVVAGLCVAAQPYLAMTSPNAKAPQ